RRRLYGDYDRRRDRVIGSSIVRHERDVQDMRARVQNCARLWAIEELTGNRRCRIQVLWSQGRPVMKRWRCRPYDVRYTTLDRQVGGAGVCTEKFRTVSERRTNRSRIDARLQRRNGGVGGRGAALRAGA